VNMALGQVLTDRAVLPPGSIRSLRDPYADEGARRRRLALWLLGAAIACALALARHYGRWPFAPP